jgi:selenocysteine-specific elongation factor
MRMRDLVLGTAGHIDHGKTAIVRALTGVDTDRLPEEKARGISIELGFAFLDLPGGTDAAVRAPRRIAVVDVPGHERFVRTMVAGASGIDLALLVVAADDSVMPQTREHLAILELLGIRRGVVAITKADLAEPSWLDLVEADVRELAQGTFLENAEVVRVSALTGAGLDALRGAIARAAAAHDAAIDEAGDLFRLCVDRSFVLRGLGTVVTGTVAAGALSAGAEVEWLPAGRLIRVRSVQSHGADADAVRRGQRAALNLMGVHHDEVQRGDVLATPGFLRSSRRVTVGVRVLPGAPALRDRERVRVHLGTQEVLAGVRLLEDEEIAPGAAGVAQLVGQTPFVAVGGQPVIVRRESPVVTVGGGRVLEPVAAPIRRLDGRALAHVRRLASPDDRERAEAAIYLEGFVAGVAMDVARGAGVTLARAIVLLGEMEAAGTLAHVGADRGALRLHHARLAEARTHVERALDALHDAAPLERFVPRERLERRLAWMGGDLVRAVVAHLASRKALVVSAGGVALPSFAPILTEQQRGLRDRVLASYLAGGFAPEGPGAIASAAGVAPEQLRPVIEVCAGMGELVRVDGELYLHRDKAAELRERIAAALAGGAGRTVSEIKDALGTSRKYAVPICEYLDRAGVTVRQGDKRYLRAAPPPAGESSA